MKDNKNIITEAEIFSVAQEVYVTEDVAQPLKEAVMRLSAVAKKE